MRSIKVIMAAALLFGFLGAHAQVVINEVTAANYSHTQDNYGEYDEWIELYNPSGNAIDLSGFYISDRPNNPTKWQIPAGCTIDAGGYQVFHCTRRDTDEGGFYHTNFKMSQCDGESAVFSDPGGNIIDVFTFDKTNQVNHSRGRYPDGSDNWVVFVDPTPGAGNASQPYQEYPELPTVTPESGFYTGTVNVEITTDYPSATIYYTLDGTTPTEASNVYTGPITLTETTVLRAVALSPDAFVPDGFIETNTYFLNEEFTVPVVSVTGDELLVLLNGTQIEPVGHFEIFDANGLMRDEGLGEYNKHGNDSWAYPQRGIDWITRDEFGYNKEINYRIFRGSTRTKFQRLMMKAAANDNYSYQAGGAHLRDLYVQSLSQIADLEMDERSGEFIVMYVNGQYWGVYDIREKVDDSDFTDYYYDQKKEDVDFLKTWGGTWAEYGTIQPWNELRDWILANDMTDPDNYAYVKSQYNTMSLIDYFILNSYVVAADWLNWNTGWWRGRNPEGGAQKWRYILWDMDAVFGHYANYTGIPDQGSGADICFPEALGNPGGQGHVPIWSALLENEEFYMDYVNRMSDMSNTYFSCEFMQNHLDSLVAILEPEMPRQIDRWAGSMDGWLENVQEVRDFIQDRCEELNGNILDCYDDLDGPYEVVVQVDPPEGGRVHMNTFTPESFPFTGQYFGGIPQNYSALPNNSFEFSHWTIDGVEVMPDLESIDIEFMLTANANITAHFEPTFLYEIVLDVLPEGSGSIVIGGENFNTFPTEVELGAGVLHDIVAEAAPGYVFDKWVVSAPNTLSPSLDQAEGQLNVFFGGSVTAHFQENNNTILFEVQPTGVGFIDFEGVRIETYPELKELPADHVYNLSAQATAPFYRFSHWDMMHHQPLPDSAQTVVDVEFNQGDVVVAHFVEIPNYTLTFKTDPENVGAIRFGDEILEEFPYTKQYEGHVPYALESMIPNKWEFDKWEFVMRPDLPGRIYPSLQYTPIRNDTIILHMNERFNQVYIPSAFTPNGDGVNELIGVQGPEIKDEGFEWVIYSRWGDLVFKTTDKRAKWNGAAMNSGYYCPVGVYTYQLNYVNAITNQSESQSGSITIIR